ncbi:MAG TPA: amidohydrolase family protein [Blastocatellia bacterium]|nr:amidohydrolase family protein [Blastocatellia bacterium]
MRLRFIIVGLILSLLFVHPVVDSARAQTRVDVDLLREVNNIQAIDNHAHPARYTAPGEKEDTEYDALPLEGLEDFALPVRLRPDNVQYAKAWHALYGYDSNDMSAEHVKQAIEKKQQAMREHGQNYPAWILDKIGIDTMLANRVAMGPSIEPPRFRWVSFVDALLLPLDTEAFRRVNPDNRVFFSGEDRLLKRYLVESNVTSMPKTLADYQTKVVTATLERHRRSGALAVKFEAAYLRSLDFGEASEADAGRIYSKYASGGEPSVAGYKILQDYLFRYIAKEAGRLGLAVHIHVLDNFGSYYRSSNSNPELLESVFNDPALRKTNFVILHAGYPQTKLTAAYIGKANVYADFSNLGLILYPRALSEVLRNWLEYFPDKVLFGTDAFPLDKGVGWEETAWLSAYTGRAALVLALTGMINDGEITRDRAVELARMVLRDNAIKLYGLNK